MPQVSLQTFVAEIRSGNRLASFPTDTVPALAARPDRAPLIFEFKQRSLDKPVILMAGALEDLWAYVTGSLEDRKIWQQVADRYLPGALTLVLPASRQVPSAMNPKDPTTIGVRIPNSSIARAILNQTGPLATTSVNRSGQPPLLTMSDIEDQFPDLLTLSPLELKALGQSSASEAPESVSSLGVPSTVARWTGAGWEILRQGPVVLEV